MFGFFVLNEGSLSVSSSLDPWSNTQIGTSGYGLQESQSYSQYYPWPVIDHIYELMSYSAQHIFNMDLNTIKGLINIMHYLIYTVIG